jgi:hypothetical protein
VLVGMTPWLSAGRRVRQRKVAPHIAEYENGNLAKNSLTAKEKTDKLGQNGPPASPAQATWLAAGGFVLPLSREKFAATNRKIAKTSFVRNKSLPPVCDRVDLDPQLPLYQGATGPSDFSKSWIALR